MVNRKFEKWEDDWSAVEYEYDELMKLRVGDEEEGEESI